MHQNIFSILAWIIINHQSILIVYKSLVHVDNKIELLYEDITRTFNIRCFKKNLIFLGANFLQKILTAYTYLLHNTKKVT